MYRDFNKKYFNDKLPKNYYIRFAKMRGCFGRTFVLKRILKADETQINVKYRHCPAQVMLTVLHEMVHIENPRHRGHGRVFNNRMLKLAKQGAFKHLW